MSLKQYLKEKEEDNILETAKQVISNQLELLMDLEEGDYDVLGVDMDVDIDAVGERLKEIVPKIQQYIMKGDLPIR